MFMRSGNMVVCGWHDTKRLTMLSTVDNNLTVDKEIRSKEHPSGKRTVEKPVAVERYNRNMAGVDRFDQMLGTYQYPHKVVPYTIPQSQRNCPCKWIYHLQKGI